MSEKNDEVKGGLVSLLPYKNLGDNYSNRWAKELVRCDLVIPRWKELVEDLDIGDDAHKVIANCEKGWYQGIPDNTLGLRKWFSPTNHKSALVAREKFENMLAKEKCALGIFAPFTHEEVYGKLGFFLSIPMGSVTNADGSFLIINNLLYPCNDPYIPLVNSFVNKEYYRTTWDDFKVVVMLFKQKGQWKLAIFDWEKAYQQIPLHV